MKRHPALQEFSRDHHQGLVHAHRLQKAAASGEEYSPRQISEAFVEFWREDTSVHFRKEEETLLPVVALHARDMDRSLLSEMLLQHAAIRGLVLKLESELREDALREDTLRELGEKLEQHIRLEERVIFPQIEESLPESALQSIPALLEARG